MVTGLKFLFHKMYEARNLASALVHIAKHFAQVCSIALSDKVGADIDFFEDGALGFLKPNRRLVGATPVDAKAGGRACKSRKQPERSEGCWGSVISEKGSFSVQTVF